EFSATLSKMSEGKVSTDASLLMPFVGSDAWGSCSFLIDQALQFTDVKKEIITQGCPYDWDMTEGSDWYSDPCCNWMLSDTMCCAPRTVEVDVPEASVDTSKLATYCAQDVEQLTMAIFASKAFVEAKADSVDPTYGCVGQRQRDLQKYKGLDKAAEECEKEVVGEHQSDGKRKSTATCTNDSECFSGTCKEAESDGGGGGGAATRHCQTSNLPEHVAACLIKKFEIVPKAQAILKDVTTNGNIKASAFQVGQGLASFAGREMCIGPDGWNFDPEWPSCKYGVDENGNYEDSWNWDTGECDEYFCQGRDDCKEKCLNTPSVCNVDPWNTAISEEDCESDKMGGNFCAMCWSGDQDCYEVSQPTVCRVNRHGHEGDQFTDEVCSALLGDDGVVETNSWTNWDGTTSYDTTCTLPTATTQEECVNVDNICEQIGFKDEWGCLAEKTVNDCWSDMPKSLRPEYAESTEGMHCWPENCDPNADDDCWCDGYASWHEHWIEYKRHHWKPVCTWEVKFDTEAEAIAGCPAVDGMEVKQLTTKEERCKNEQFCFAKDLPLTVMSLFDSSDWGCMHPASGSACVQEHLTNGDQSSCAEIDAFKDCVDSSSDDQCNNESDFEEKFAKIKTCICDGTCDGTQRRQCESIDRSDLLNDFNANGGNAMYGEPHTRFNDELQLCMVEFETWGGMANLAAAATTCGAMDGFTWKTGKYYEEGRFDTEEKCTAGVCD
ncbi:hypothetical protein TrRE_jg645, partial [Triparma retinervis]